MKPQRCLPVLTTLAVLFSYLVIPTHPAYAQGAFTYLEDGAEEGGYDVVATIDKLPAELILAQQENNDGYVIRATTENIELAIYKSGARQVLTSVRINVAPGPLVVQRRGIRWNVIVNNRVVLQAEDESWQEGKIGFRGGFTNVRVQPVEGISFDDDFMRIAEEVAMEKARENPTQGVKISEVSVVETLWTPLSGGWNTTGLSENQAAQVAQSVNPFAFKSNSVGTNLAVAGRAFWNDYEFGISVKPQGSTAIGLAVYVQDAKNYLLFHWQEKGPMQLRAVTTSAGGPSEVRVLDEATLEPNGGFEQKQWYRVRLSVAGGVLRAYVDDIEMLRARTGYFGRGQIGVYSENPSADNYTTFDDVNVRSVSDIHDDFSTSVSGRWQTRTGTWKLTGQAAPVGTQSAVTVMGEPDWQNYTASADINLPVDASAGLVLHHQVGKGMYNLRVTGSKARLPYAGTVQIVRMQDGKTEVLAEKKTGTLYDNSTFRWSLSSDNGYLKASVDVAGVSKLVVDAFDETIPNGRAGLYGHRGGQGTTRLSTFAVEFPRARTTWAKVPDLYELERQAVTMGGWSTPEGFWAPTNPLGTVKTTTVGGTTTTAPTTPATATPAPGNTATPSNKILWHKGAFWGDDSIRFKLPKLSAGQAVTLILGDARRPNSQALLLQTDSDVLKASLSSAELSGSDLKIEAPVAARGGQIKIEGAADAQLVEVIRRGSFLIVRAGTAETMSTLIAARVYR